MQNARPRERSDERATHSRRLNNQPRDGDGFCRAQSGAAVIDQLRDIFRQPEIIVGTWRAARTEQSDITEAEAREALTQLDPLWDELFPAEQARIVQLLVERVDVRMNGVEVRLRPTGLAGNVREVTGSRRAAA
jgi:site-specific DNA recombinase